MQHPVNRTRAVAAVVAACALFGTTGTALQRGSRDATSLGVGAARLLLGGTTLALVAAWQRPAGGRSWRAHLPSAALGAAMVAVYQLSFFDATRHAGVAIGTVCTIASGPVFAGVLGWVLDRSLPSSRWAMGTATCVVGVVLLVAVGRPAGHVEARGIAMALLSGFGYACYATIAKRQMDRGLDPAASMAALFLGGGIITSPLLLVEPMHWITTGRGTLMIVHLGVITCGLAYTMYGRGLRHLPAPTVVTLTLVEPVTAALLSVVVLHERLAVAGWLGILVVLGGLVVATRPAASDEALPATDTVPA